MIKLNQEGEKKESTVWVLFAFASVLALVIFGCLERPEIQKDCIKDAACFEKAIRNCEEVRIDYGNQEGKPQVSSPDLQPLLKDQYFKESDCLMTYELRHITFFASNEVICESSDKPLEVNHYYDGSFDYERSLLISKVGPNTRYLNCIYEYPT